MKLPVVLAVLLVGSTALAQWSYPTTKTVDVVDTYFGKTYKDPYRWLENLKDQTVESWFKAQAELTDGVLGKLPARDKLAAEWLALDKLKPVQYSDFRVENGRVFYRKRLGGENLGKLYYRVGWNGAEKLLFDPASYRLPVARPGDKTTIVAYDPSPDGKFVALSFSAAGAEFSEIRVLDVEHDQLLPESVYPSYGSSGWTHDSKRLFYDAGKVTDIKSPEIELNRKTRLHTLGTPVAGDVDFFSNETDPALGIEPKEFPVAWQGEHSPEWIYADVSTVRSELRRYYAPASQLAQGKKIKWSVLCKHSDNLVRGLAVFKDKVFAVTHQGAQRYKVLRTSMQHPDWQKAETVIPEAQDSIQYLASSKDLLFVVYSDGITGRIVQYDPRSGRSSALKLPVQGTANISCPDAHGNRCLVFIDSWTRPTTTWDYDGDHGTLTKSAFDTSVAYPGFESLVTEEVEVPSHDGTLVPLSIVHRKSLKLDGSSSAILDGYGAYGSSYEPSFSVMRSLALHDVVLGYCHPRGGSEKGEAWYKAGFKTTKPNTWKDFIACGEYLVKKGYTSPSKLAGTGTSAGGILISRAITERPDLFAAAIVNVGCANAMRMEFSPNGPANTPEFGTVKDAVEAEALYEMDGVQHVKAGVKYPAVLGVAGWNDPRVVPWEPGKFVAAVQAASTSKKPALLKVNYDNGHFTEERLVTFKNFASQFAFLLWQTGHPEFQPVAR